MRSLPKLIPGVHEKLPGDAQDHVKRLYSHAEEHRAELNLYITGEEELEPERGDARRPRRRSSPSPTRRASDERRCSSPTGPAASPAASRPSCTARWRWSPSGSGSSW